MKRSYTRRTFKDKSYQQKLFDYIDLRELEGLIYKIVQQLSPQQKDLWTKWYFAGDWNMRKEIAEGT